MSEVDFSNLKEVKVGEKEDTKVISVVKGSQESFRTDKYWEKVEDTKENIEKMKKQPAVEIKTENGASVVINMPISDKVNPASKLAMWKKTYGDYPSGGQAVTTKVDENGFNRIILETI